MALTLPQSPGFLSLPPPQENRAQRAADRRKDFHQRDDVETSQLVKQSGAGKFGQRYLKINP